MLFPLIDSFDDRFFGGQQQEFCSHSTETQIDMSMRQDFDNLDSVFGRCASPFLGCDDDQISLDGDDQISFRSDHFSLDELKKDRVSPLELENSALHESRNIESWDDTPLPYDLMGQLAKSMNRSAHSRGLVANFFPSSALPNNVSCTLPANAPCKSQGESISTCETRPAALKRRSKSLKKVKVAFKHGHRGRAAKPTQIDDKTTSSGSFRLSGLKLSGEKLKRLDEKLKLLEATQESSTRQNATNMSTIALHRQKAARTA